MPEPSFLKRDDTLEGAVTVYVKYKGEPGENFDTDSSGLVAFCCTDDVVRIHDIMGFPRPDLEELLDPSIKQFRIQVNGNNPIDVYGAQIFPGTEVDLSIRPEDVVNSGIEATCPAEIQQAITKGLLFYFFNYQKEQGNNPTIPTETTYAHYSELKPGVMTEYLMNNYTRPMIESVRRGDEETFNHYKNLFLEFVDIDPLKQNAERLCHLIFESGIEQQGILARQYLTQMEHMRIALVDQKFENAATARNRIADIEREYSRLMS